MTGKARSQAYPKQIELSVLPLYFSRLCKPMTSKVFATQSVVIHSSSSAISEVYEWVLSQLKANNFSREDIFGVHLALQEAFINAVRHGNKMDTSKNVRIDSSVGLDKVEISIMDQGEGFDPDAVPDPRCGNNLYKSGGRGLLLIRSYMDVVEFNKQGNCVRLVRYKKKGSSTHCFLLKRRENI